MTQVISARVQPDEETNSIKDLEVRFAQINSDIEARTLKAHRDKRFQWTAKEAKEIKKLQDEAAELLSRIHAAKVKH